MPDQAALALSLIENIQREDLNPLEEAQGIARLIEEFKLTHDAAAAAVGRSRSAVSNLLRLTQLAKPVQALLLADKLDMGHARALLALPAASQVSAAGRIVAQNLSVRDTERLVQALLAPSARRAKTMHRKQPDGDVARLERELADILGASVRIEPTRKGAGRRGHRLFESRAARRHPGQAAQGIVDSAASDETLIVKLRRIVLVAWSVATLSLPFGAFAAQDARVYRVAWLGTGSPSSDIEFREEVRSVLRDLGYRDDRSVVFERRDAENIPGATPGTCRRTRRTEAGRHRGWRERGNAGRHAGNEDGPDRDARRGRSRR